MQLIEIIKKIEELLASCKIIGNLSAEKTLNMWLSFVRTVEELGGKLLEDSGKEMLKHITQFLEREQYLIQEFGQTLMHFDRVLEEDTDLEEEDLESPGTPPPSPMVAKRPRPWK